MQQRLPKLSLYLDRWIAPASDKLPLSLRLQLRWSSILVVVCTENAVGSPFVQEEVARFAKLRRKVVMVDVGGVYNAVRGRAPWVKVSGADPEDESREAVESGEPSENVIERILKSVEFTTQDRRLRRAVWATLAFVALSVGGTGVYSLLTVRVANAKAADAEQRAAKAEVAERTANENAVAARSLAEAESIKAGKAGELAREQTELAETAKKRADEQTQKAERAEERAEIATKEATKQENIARSRELSAQAVNLMDKRLDLALSYSLDAFDIASPPTLEARQSLLAGLTFSPHLRAFVSRRDYSAFGQGLAASADGRLIVSIEDQKKVLLWRNTSRPSEPLTLYEDGKGESWAVAISRDGKTVAAGYGDKTVKFWDTATSRQWEKVLNYPSDVHVLAFNLRGDKLGVGLGDGSVYVWEVNSASDTGRLLGSHPPNPDHGDYNFVQLLAFSPDDKSLASYSELDSLIIWDITQQQGDNKLSVLEFDRVRTISFSPDSRILAFNSGREIKLWERNTRALARRFGEDDPSLSFSFWVGEGARTSDHPEDEVISITFDPKGEYLISVSEWKRLNQWFLEISNDDDQGGARPIELAVTRDPSDVLLKSPDDFSSATFADDGRTIISQSPEGRITAWSVDPQPALSSTLDGGYTWDMSFHPVTGALISVGDYGLVVWDGSRRRIVKENTPGLGATTPDETSKGWRSLTISADGSRIIAGAWTNKYTLLDADSYETRYSFTLPKNTDESFVTFDPDLRLAIAADTDGKYYLWELGEQPVRLALIEGRPPFAFGKGVLIGSTPETLCLWEVGNPKKPRRIDEQPLDYRPTSFAFTRDSKLLASVGEGGRVFLWSVGEKLRRVELHGAIPAEFVPVPTGSTVTFSPSNQVLAASGHGSQAVTLWDISAGRLLGNIPSWRGDVDKLCFSPDGKRLAAQVATGIMLWEVNPEVWKARALFDRKRQERQKIVKFLWSGAGVGFYG